MPRSRPIPYSAEELAWVEAHKTLARKEMAEKFATRFGRDDVTADHLKALCSRNGWSAGPAGRKRRKGKSTLFTGEQIEWLKANAELSREETYRQFCAAFPDIDVTRAQIISFRKNHGIRSGRTGHFEKGHEPWSKGRKIGSKGNSRKTQFKKGARAHNRIGPGHERICKRTGYVILIVAEENPWSGASTRPVQKHRWLWEQANGPVPEGHVLKSLDGDRTNCDPKNWEAVPRGLLPRLNGKSGRDYDRAPQDVKPAIMATAKLEHALRNINRKDKK
jgi:hypothetical protein